MPNEMTAAEAADRICRLIANGKGMGGVVSISGYYFEDALKFAASILRRVASGGLTPVIHAHWIEKTSSWNMGCEKYLACSNCGERQCDTYSDKGNTHCDSCGALMDEPVVSQAQDGKDDNHA